MNSMLQEMAEAMKDPKVPIEKYMRTFDNTQGGLVNFKLFPMQKRLVDALEAHRFNIVTKPRQTGISTTTAAYLAVKCALADSENPETIMIVANKLAQSKEFLAKIRAFLQYIPKFYWAGEYNEEKENEGYIVGKGSTQHLRLQNNSQIIAKATSPDALRGYTPTYIVIDEAAYIESFAEELYRATVAAINTGGKMTLISTPNGHDPLYYKVYEGAISGKNDFNVVELKWYQDPRYNKDLKWTKRGENDDLEIIVEEDFTLESYANMVRKGYSPTSPWYEETKRLMNHNKLSIARELDVLFEGSANTVIDADVIKRQKQQYCFDPITKINREYTFDFPEDDFQYVMGVDVSSGLSKDFSTIVVFCINTGRVVYTYKEKIKPDKFADIVYKVGMLYNALTVVDETGGYGSHVIQHLINNDYEHLYYEQKELEKKLKELPCRAGLKITGVLRIQVISKFVTYVEAYEMKLSDLRIAIELDSFIMANGRPDHKDGFNDDLIFAAALAIWGYEMGFKQMEKQRELNNRKMELLKYAMEAKNNTTGKSKMERNKLDIFRNVSKKMLHQSQEDRYSKQHREDMRWVLGK